MQYCTRNPAIKKPELSDASSIIDINDNMDVIDGIICKSNFNGATDPGIGDDIVDGYSVGSNWWNVTDHRLFVAESVATGAAVWRQIYPTIDALMPDGSVPLSANWDAGAYEIRAQTFESDQATGTAPLVVASTTKVTNLNADKLDGLDDTAFLKHSLATAANDFLVASGTGSFVKKTLAETQAILAGYNSLYVTVGPTGCDYTTDGVSDEDEINTALATGKPVIINGLVICDHQITIPSTGNPVLIGIDATILCDQIADGGNIISSYGQLNNAVISGLKINGNGKYVNGIFLYAGAVNCRIENNEIYNIIQSDADTVYPLWLYGDISGLVRDNTISNNYVHDNIAGNQIFVSNYHKFVNHITGNTIYHGKPYGTQQYSGIYGDNCIITDNTVIGYGSKTQSYSTCAGTGIGGGENAVISNNTIIGTGSSGIVPGYKNVVDGNKIIAPGCNGIDAWYSSNSIISENSIFYPGNMDESGVVSWDQCGVDLCNHSADIQVVRNNVYGSSVDISSVLSSQATSGNNYITVSSPDLYYEGLRIKIGSNDKYRIDYIDPVNSRIYLTTSLTTTYASGTTVIGVNCMTIGINVGDNGQSLGFHTVTGNSIFASTAGNYLESGASMLPHTYVDDFVYTSDPEFYRIGHAPFILYTDGNYYIAVYITGVGIKKIQIA